MLPVYFIILLMLSHITVFYSLFSLSFFLQLTLFYFVYNTQVADDKLLSLYFKTLVM